MRRLTNNLRLLHALVFAGVPVIPWRQLVMSAMFIAVWTVLVWAGLTASLAFVWAAVIAQATHLWTMLPLSASQGARTGDLRYLPWVLVACFFIFAVQVILADPLVTQRFVSAFCLIFAILLLLARAGEQRSRDRVAPVDAGQSVCDEFYRFLLGLKLAIVLVVLAVNEMLLLSNATLDLRVVILALLPIPLHYAYWIALLTLAPPAKSGAE